MTTKEVQMTEPPAVGAIVHFHGGRVRVTKVVPTGPDRWGAGPSRDSYEFCAPGQGVPTHTVHYERID